MVTSDLDHAIEQYHRALDEIVKGNPEPDKEMFSHRDDVSLANPLGPPVRGWEQVEATMERAASLLRDGEPTVFERIVTCETAELAFIVEIERTRVRLGGSQDVVPVTLRVTTIFRPEDGTWKVVHRHADPITSPRPPESMIQQ
jgi:ketosteroid isomerase-like protein